MKLVFEKGGLTVIREETDPLYYGVGGAKGESRLLYAIKKQLQKMGFDVIKKRMWKDGHLVDDMQQYLRSKDGNWCAFNGHWAIEGLEGRFNTGTCYLVTKGTLTK